MTVYYALECEGKKIPFAYDLKGSLMAFNHIEDKIKFLLQCKLTEKGCQRQCDRHNKKIKK